MLETMMPQFLAPMLLTLVKEPFDSPDWIFEPKLDGYRAIAVIDSAGKARVWSRNQLPLEPKLPTVGEDVRKLNLGSTILDAEIVALDSEGIPRFQLLQKWQKRPLLRSSTICSTFFGVRVLERTEKRIEARSDLIGAPISL